MNCSQVSLHDRHAMNDEPMIELTLDGQPVRAAPGTSLWALARAHGIELPHLCHLPDGPGGLGLRPAGNCCACMVEIDGEERLAAACCRQVEAGMALRTDGVRASRVRALVVELLASDALARSDEPALSSELGRRAHSLGVDAPRFPRRALLEVPLDRTHADIAVDLDACIQCTRCLRACRDEQGYNVIGLAYIGGTARIVFDADVPMGDSTCVSCGECVRVCPTGAFSAA
jgi:formate dehydrogenase major subunit